MIILGIESSCDETAAAIVVDGHEVRSSVVASQEKLHEKFGGVIPEVACRAHVQAVLPVIKQTMDAAGVTETDIDAIAIANRPGLVGSLLIGLTSAKSLALAWNKPLIGIDHLQAHMYAAALEHEDIFPAVGMVVSGGHTAVFNCDDPLSFELLGSTIDDAAGEAFDKVASILKLGYPGGPVIDRLAKKGDPKRFSFPRTFIKEADLRFSFSGIKTAVLYHCQGHTYGKGSIREDIDEQEICDIAASFQEAVVDVLVSKLVGAARINNINSIVVGGGVACNSRFRARLEESGIENVYMPSIKYCVDNAAMVAGLAFYHVRAGHKDDLLLEASPRPLRM